MCAIFGCSSSFSILRSSNIAICYILNCYKLNIPLYSNIIWYKNRSKRCESSCKIFNVNFASCAFCALAWKTAKHMCVCMCVCVCVCVCVCKCVLVSAIAQRHIQLCLSIFSSLSKLLCIEIRHISVQCKMPTAAETYLLTLRIDMSMLRQSGRGR